MPKSKSKNTPSTLTRERVESYGSALLALLTWVLPDTAWWAIAPAWLIMLVLCIDLTWRSRWTIKWRREVRLALSCFLLFLALVGILLTVKAKEPASVPTADEIASTLAKKLPLLEPMAGGGQVTRPTTPSTGPLELVDFTVIDTMAGIESFRATWFSSNVFRQSRDGFPILDLKLRNLGSVTAFLKRLHIQAKRIATGERYERSSINCRYQEVTWEYSVLLDPLPGIADYSVPLSQVIAPFGADRFVIVVGQADDPPERYSYHEDKYQLEMRLDYNKSDFLKLGIAEITSWSATCAKTQDKPVGIRRPNSPTGG